jgi:hypothetical protein
MPLTADTSEPLLITGTPGLTDMTFRQFRQLSQAVAGKGAMSPTDLLVSAPGGMQVQVAAGYAWVPGTVLVGPEGQHKYGVPLTAAKTLGAIPAPAGATRRDSVVLRVLDSGDGDGSGMQLGRVEYRVNPSESVTPEALPANAILLAYVDVTVAAAAITAGMITDRRWIVSSPVPLVTALPLNPYDGQVIDLQTTAMQAAGIVWRFRYRADAGTYKWEFVGGPPWVANVDTDEGAGTANTWVNLATDGASVTPGVAGEFSASATANTYTSATNNRQGRIGVAAGNTTPARWSAANLVTANYRLPLAITDMVTLGASDAAKMRYYGESGTNVRFEYRTLALTPRRVG